MSYTMHTEGFEAGMAKYEAALKEEVQGILKRSSVVYGERAAKYVPPLVNGKWTKSIPAKMYKRDFVAPIWALVRSGDTRNRQMFVDRLREGYRFCVRGLLRGKVHWWFATTLRKARTYCRIFNRGLFKFLFGANFRSIGEPTPSYFTHLLNRSPNLAKHAHEHILEMKSENGAESIRIVNDAWNNQAFARESKYQGEKAARTAMRQMWKAWEERRREV